MTHRPALLKSYRLLQRRFGPQHWWPARTPFEVIVGAILTQNTAWSNVERAISNLKKGRLLSVKGLTRVSSSRLAQLIKPSGYYNQKAIKLKAFIKFLHSEYGGFLSRMSVEKTDVLREQLLSVHGIGPETADSILLYAFSRPAFVVDAYTMRIFERHGIIKHGATYHDVQRLMTECLPGQAKLFNEYHALIVRTGKEFCRKKPNCGKCPLKGLSKTIMR